MISDLITIYISSEKKISGTNANFRYVLNIDNTLLQKCTHISTTYVKIPKSFYNISSGYNRFILIEDTQETIIYVPPGNYTKTQWYEQVKRLLDENSQFSIKYIVADEHNTYNTGKMLIVAEYIGIHSIALKFEGEKDMNAEFGCAKNSTNYFINDNIFISPMVINLNSRSSMIYINIDQISSKVSNGNNNSNTLCILNGESTSPFSNIVYYWEDLVINMKPLTNAVDSIINIKILDENEREYDINNASIFITLHFFKYNENLLKKINNYIDYKLLNDENNI